MEQRVWTRKQEAMRPDTGVETEGRAPLKPSVQTHEPAPIAPGKDRYNVLVITEPTWIEIELIGEDDGPIPGEAYRVMTPDGALHEGTLDETGVARIDVKRKGNCLVTFPKLDQDAWAKL